MDLNFLLNELCCELCNRISLGAIYFDDATIKELRKDFEKAKVPLEHCLRDICMTVSLSLDALDKSGEEKKKEGLRLKTHLERATSCIQQARRKVVSGKADLTEKQIVAMSDILFPEAVGVVTKNDLISILTLGTFHVALRFVCDMWLELKR